MCTETWQLGTACKNINVIIIYYISILQFATDTTCTVYLCRLDHQGNVKVGDFGLAEDMYATCYVREKSKVVKVPYKWMPPESFEDGLFSEHSDVV